MNGNECSARVYSPGGSFRGHPCGKAPKMQHEGRWYCGTHDPVKQKARRDASVAKWESEWNRKGRIAVAEQAMKDARQALLDDVVRRGGPLVDAYESAVIALTKAHES